jgi:hypothetical protein
MLHEAVRTACAVALPLAPHSSPGFSVFFLTPSASVASAPLTVPAKVSAASPQAGPDQVLSNGLVSVTISGVTGLLSRFQVGSIAKSLVFSRAAFTPPPPLCSASLLCLLPQNPAAGIDLPLTQNWSYFRGATNISSPQASGAYVFR